MEQKGRRKPRFAMLRALMMRFGVTQIELAYAYNKDHPGANKGPYWVNRMLCAKAPIRMDVAYWIIDFFEIPHAQLNEYFPPEGIQEDVA